MPVLEVKKSRRNVKNTENITRNIQNDKNKRNSKITKKHPGLYIIGSLALATGAMMAAPVVIDYIADRLSDTALLNSGPEDFPGPEIVRRQKTFKEAEDGEF